ncbi:MAG TPA: RNA 2',3'-cyclic phosphodiesterase [Povalibacter sp.]
MSETGRAPSRRLFFALWPTDSLRAQIHQQTLEAVQQAACRPVAVRNLHVTLLFLGSIAHDRIAEVVAAAEAVRGAQFELQFDHLEVWPRAKVLVLTASVTPPQLASLVEGLRISLLQRQVVLQPEEYRPHLTLARNVSRREPAPSLPVSWRVTDFVLVESTTGPNYQVIARWPLA